MIEVKKMTNLRQRTNIARKLQPQLCMNKKGKAVWGMRSVSDQTKCIQIEVVKSITNTTVGKKEVVRHGLYTCRVHRIDAQGWVDYYGPHLLEYAIASIVGETNRAGKKIIFYSLLESAILKRKIVKGSLIEVACGKNKIWAIVFNL